MSGNAQFVIGSADVIRSRWVDASCRVISRIESMSRVIIGIEMPNLGVRTLRLRAIRGELEADGIDSATLFPPSALRRKQNPNFCRRIHEDASEKTKLGTRKPLTAHRSLIFSILSHNTSLSRLSSSLLLIHLNIASCCSSSLPRSWSWFPRFLLWVKGIGCKWCHEDDKMF